MDEKELLQGCRRRDKVCWDRLVQQYSRLVWWAIHETLKGSDFSKRGGLAEEIFQDLFSRLLANPDVLELRDSKSLPKFLTVMACHESLDKIKALSRRESRVESIQAPIFAGDGEEIFEDPTDILHKMGDHEVLKNERQTLVGEVLQSLSAKDRAVIEYHFYEEKTHREIGLILGMPQDTISSIVRRAKEKLKQLFIKKGLAP